MREHLAAVAPIVRELRERRIALGISQEALGHRLGVAEGLVSKWEVGRKQPGAFLLACWAQALGLVPVLLPAAPGSRASAPRPRTGGSLLRGWNAIATTSCAS